MPDGVVELAELVGLAGADVVGVGDAQPGPDGLTLAVVGGWLVVGAPSGVVDTAGEVGVADVGVPVGDGGQEGSGEIGADEVGLGVGLGEGLVVAAIGGPSLTGGSRFGLLVGGLPAGMLTCTSKSPAA